MNKDDINNKGKNSPKGRKGYDVAQSTAAPVEKVSQELLEALDNLFGLHPGFRPVHAKGVMCSGNFTPSAQAAALTRAPHVQSPLTKVIVRFSNFGGVPTIPDNDPNANPRGFAIRFYLAPHVHTDIIGHSHNGFPQELAKSSWN